MAAKGRLNLQITDKAGLSLALFKALLSLSS
jgi:hypothetical protein